MVDNARQLHGLDFKGESELEGEREGEREMVDLIKDLLKDVDEGSRQSILSAVQFSFSV